MKFIIKFPETVDKHWGEWGILVPFLRTPEYWGTETAARFYISNNFQIVPIGEDETEKHEERNHD